MQEALKLAEKAYKKDEVPVGAIIVSNGKIIAKAFNTREKSKDATNHAEIVAIKRACKKLRDFRLLDAEMYVTLEPCMMCLGAILNARLKKVYFGASSNKENTYDFDTDDKIKEIKERDSLDEIPEDLQEAEEDRALDEKEAEQQKKFDNAMNWISLAAISVTLIILIISFFS